MRAGLVLALVVALTGAAPVMAQGGDNALDERAMRTIRESPEQAIRGYVAQLIGIAPDGELDAAELDLYLRLQRAQVRAAGLRQFLVFDLDGDMALSGDEIAEASPRMQPNQRVAVETALALHDGNGDGSLSTAELAAAASAEPGANSGPFESRVRMLFAFDENGDGTVTIPELIEVVRQVAATEPPRQAARTATQTAKQPRQPATLKAACQLPQPSAEAGIVLIGGYEGGALSTVTIAGQDNATEVATISIENGDAPLYLLVSAYSNVIFRLEGDVDRVERFIGLEGHGRAGVTGLGADKVVLTAGRNCGAQYFTKTSDRNARTATGRANALLGRVPDKVIAAYTLGTVRLPSGKIMPEKQSHDGIDIIIHNGNRYVMTADGVEKIEDAPTQGDATAGARAALRRFHPGGVIAVDPGRVVASGAAEPYQVMPQEAGLVQLVEQGLLQPVERGTYRITGPIPRFPAGLNGAHSVTFLLADGVAMPGGSPGHSTVINEADGACLKGARCR